MITKQELEEKIANGENIWCIYQDEQEVDVLPINKSMKWKIRENNLIVEEDWFYPIKYLFNSRSEAEHYLHHANITRTEMLPFLTWEEFLSIGIMTFAGVNNLDYELVRDAGVYNAITIYENGNELFEYDLTEENFYKAYDGCVKLFKGEESK